LAKSLQELGIRASVNTERANCADVVGRSLYHEYSLVSDAKAFRLSRTARNQKDFKVKSLADWKIGNDYAVLVCPYFKYPKNSSQIYVKLLIQYMSFQLGTFVLFVRKRCKRDA
jgi:type II restriction enzyme